MRLKFSIMKIIDYQQNQQNSCWFKQILFWVQNHDTKIFCFCFFPETKVLSVRRNTINRVYWIKITQIIYQNNLAICVFGADGLIHIWKYEGLKSLWAGTLPSLILVSNPAIQFMTYESIKRRVNTSLSGAQPPAWIIFSIGAIAKTIATTLTYPLQLVQTKLRVIQILFPYARLEQNRQVTILQRI